MRKIVMLLMCVVLSGCAVSTKQEMKDVKIKDPNIIPLENHLIQTRQDFKDAYGDTLQTRMIYNDAVLRVSIMEIAEMIKKLHPPVDPNAIPAVPTVSGNKNLRFILEELERRIEELEKNRLYPSDPNVSTLEQRIKRLEEMNVIYIYSEPGK